MSPERGPITIRELRPSDRPAVAFAFRHLGERSRYQRFFTAKPTLAPRELDRLLDVDHWHHEALIAYSPSPRAPIGIGRYVRLDDDYEAAEIAIAVVDNWQRQGVGTALLETLKESALRAGIRHFTATMLRDNKSARALVAHLGPPTPLSAGGHAIQLRFDLSAGHPAATARSPKAA